MAPYTTSMKSGVARDIVVDMALVTIHTSERRLDVRNGPKRPPTTLSAAPAPVLRAWAYMLSVGGAYVGTPSGLYEEMADKGCKISRRSLPIALDWLKSLGLADINRRGSYLSVELVGGDAQ